MAAAIKQLRPKAKVRSDRAALVAALKQAEAAHQDVERQRAGIERSRASVRAAETAVKAADEAVKSAQKNHAVALANAAATDKAPPPSSIRAARQAATDAADELEAARSAFEQLRKSSLPNAIETAREADIEIDKQISLILLPHAEELLALAKELQRTFLPVRRALCDLWEKAPTATDEYLAFEKARKPLAETRNSVKKFFETLDVVDRSSPNPWSAARELLRSNPQAELPLFATPVLSDETAVRETPRAS